MGESIMNRSRNANQGRVKHHGNVQENIPCLVRLEDVCGGEQPELSPGRWVGQTGRAWAPLQGDRLYLLDNEETRKDFKQENELHGQIYLN